MHRALLVLAVGLTLTACGDTARPATEPRVKLKLEAPDDGGSIRADHIAITGTVTPADAAVRISGQSVTVSAGQFSADVELQPGGNVIDVSAVASGRRPATDALRIFRDMRIEIPNVLGQSPEDAAAKLESADLKSVEERSGSWIDRLLSPVKVCATRPAAGQLVDKGTQITLETAPDC